MGAQLGAFPDAETVVMALLEPVAPTVTATPAKWDGEIIRVQRVGGSDDGITDYPRMEIACYGPDRVTAWRLAERCRQLILASIRHVVDTAAGLLIDNARTDKPPTQIPYSTTEDVRRVMAYYRFAWRRRY